MRTNQSGNSIIILLIIVALVVAAFIVFTQKDLVQNLPLPIPQSNTQKVSTFPKVTVADSQIISGFPEFPNYPNAKVTSSQHSEGKSDPFYQPEFYQVYLETSDTVEDVIGWYTQEVQKQGWEIDRAADPKLGDDQNIVISKPGYMATVNVEEEDSETTIAVYVKAQ